MYAVYITQPGTVCGCFIETAPASAQASTALAAGMPDLQSTTWSNNMCGESISTVDFETFEKTLSFVIDSARSLDEIEVWLKSQQGVKSVQIADYL
jgi:hypothetical protein